MVYLLHFDHPYHHARHYLGYTDDLSQRIAAHRNGNGHARLMEVIHAAGIGFELARVWYEADRKFERQLKNRHNAPRLCPLCNPRLAHLRFQPEENLNFTLDEIEPIPY